MKFIELENYTNGRIAITQVRGLVFSPGESKKVHPNTVQHPAVAVFIGNGLRIVPEGTAPTQEPKAPEQTAPVKVEKPIVPASEPIAAAVIVATEAGDDSTPESNDVSSGDLREIYLSAPGVEASNVDDLLAKFPTIEALKAADKDALTEMGLSKNQAKKLIAWASDN